MAKEWLQQAQAKRDEAGRIRAMTRGMSLLSDQDTLVRHAAALEADAAELERRAAAEKKP